MLIEHSGRINAKKRTNRKAEHYIADLEEQKVGRFKYELCNL